MPATSIACAICESPLREQIEKLDSEMKDIQIVRWARKQGLNISRFSLLKHRTNHLPPVNSDDNGNGNGTSSIPGNGDQVVTLQPLDLKKPDSSESPPPKPSAKKYDKRRRASKSDMPIEQPSLSGQIAEPQAETSAIPSERSDATPPAKPSPAITDELLLNTVRDKVFEKLSRGEIKLDLGDGFKAIEIKHKIAEESQNETLLLEILNEIRSQELPG